MSDQPHLLFERDGHVATLTMNRPEAKNALSSEMLARMYDGWVEVDENSEIRVCILTGAGGTFCAGMDLKAFASGFQADTWTERFASDSDLAWKALLRHFRPRKPIICAVEGYALAGGTEILQGTDIRVAGEGAVFGISEVARGLFPLGGSTVRLRRQIPYTVAAEMLLTGRRVPAQEAKEIGLIGHVVPDGQALAKAHELAAVIAANAPLSVQAVLRSLREGAEMSEADALANELEIGSPIFATNDAKEGATAFKEKRPANFTGT
ncbi:MAG: enoyl-CoA hydratase [Acidimicrobiaceae bacterium]|jgi:enoyl-CoA hydratase